MINVHKSDAKSCSACGNLNGSAKEVRLQSPSGSCIQSFRLCGPCRSELKKQL